MFDYYRVLIREQEIMALFLRANPALSFHLGLCKQNLSPPLRGAPDFQDSGTQSRM